MEEKILLKSESGTNIIILFATFYFLVGFLIRNLLVGVPSYLAFEDYFTSLLYFWDPAPYAFWPAVFLFIFGILVSGSELVVTDKRVYGTAIFKKRVDLPVDSISAVGTSWARGIAVSSSSGRVSFFFIKNNTEIHSCISQVLLERQNKQAGGTVIKQEISQSNADELKKFKELLDLGVITQSEFDAKKKQLLGL